MKKFYRELQALMSGYGFSEKRKTGKHIMWVNDKGKTITTSVSPSCHHAWKNIESMARSFSNNS